MWNWQHPDWPNFEYDPSLFKERVEAFYRSAERLSGRIEGMAERYQSDTVIDLMLSEAITTSAIEGETLDRDSVRSSLLHLIGKEVASPNSDEKAAGAAALMVDVRKRWDQPLTHELLGGWQTMACPEDRTSLALRGMYRGDAMQIVSGPIGHYKIHFEAPAAKDVPGEMDRFLDWYNSTNPEKAIAPEIPGPIRAAVAHLWFESIHPFDDGNGRVGRAISDHALSQSLGRPTIACLATAINEDRKNYYSALAQSSKDGSLNINPFIDFFTATVNKAQDVARDEVDFVLNKARFYEAFADQLNDRQAKAIARVFAEGRKGFSGGLSGKNYMAITKCSQSTATRDLTELRDIGALASHGQGRSTRYEIAFPAPQQAAFLTRGSTQGVDPMELNLAPDTPEQESLEEKISELMESNDVQSSLVVENAIRSGNLEDIRIALMEVDRMMEALEAGLSEVSDHDWASTEMDRDAIMDRMQKRADGPYAELTENYLSQVAAEKEATIWPAKPDHQYSGEIVDADERFIYQQVADNTLIAHRADEFQDPGSELVGMDLTIAQQPDREQEASDKRMKKIEPNQKANSKEKGHDLGR